jgi:hypothetical protein
MGCHLGWHFPVGCPLRGGRAEYIIKKTIGTSVQPKTIEEKKYLGEFEDKIEITQKP